MCIKCEAKAAIESGDMVKLAKLFELTYEALDAAVTVAFYTQQGKRSPSAFQELEDKLRPLMERGTPRSAELDALVSALESIFNPQSKVENKISVSIEDAKLSTIVEMLKASKNKNRTRH